MRSVESREISCKQIIIRAGGAAGVVLASLFGSGLEVKPVFAGDPPTPVPVAAPTPVVPIPIGALTATVPPDPWDIRIADAYKTSTATVKENIEAGVRATQTVIKGETNALRGTPTATATAPATGTATSTPPPTATLTQEQIEIKQRAGLLPANTPTYTAPPEKPGTQESPGGGEFPLDLVRNVLGSVIALGAAAGIYRWRRGRWI